MLAAIATGIAAAGLAGLGFVIQQQAAAAQPPSDLLRLRLLLHLARQPSWLLGILAMISGQLLGATALSMGGLGLVEPLLAANLLFALAISAVWKRRSLARREWAGAVVLAAGLGGFVVAGRPGGGEVMRLPWPNWAWSMGAIVAVAAVLVRRSRGKPRVAIGRNLGAAAGVMFGLQDALTRRTLAVLPHGGLLSLLEQWPTYVLVAVGIGSLLLAQSAFESAPLPASLPPMTFAEPLTGIAFGAGVYSEHLDLGPLHVALELAALAAAAVGVWLVAASETLTVRGTSAAEAIDDVAPPYPPETGTRRPVEGPRPLSAEKAAGPTISRDVAG